jgi:general secretion pathway protein G
VTTGTSDQQFRSAPARMASLSTGAARALFLPRAGFTLVELLIAVAILAVLAAIAVPTYRSYYDRAKVAQAKSDVRGLENIINRYFSDNRQYPDSLADIGKAGMLDPWNHAYQYLKLFPYDKKNAGKARKDHNLHPINSDFDLYSMGKDGKTATPLTAGPSRDDIVRANNGRFLGLGSDY